MTLPYYERLVCLCFATFFVVHGLTWLALQSLTRVALRKASTIPTRSAARLLFALRMTPLATASLIVFGCCVPSYVWLEPDAANERAGVAFLLSAMLGGIVWIVPLMRGAKSLWRTRRYLQACSRNRTDRTVGCDRNVVVINDHRVVMAVAGIVRPRIVVSRAVINALTQEEREAAFRHEAAHRVALDNLKKFLFLIAPDVLPFVSGQLKLERGWAHYAEWAADDAAVDGNTARALSLAAALVRVAKMGVPPTPKFLLASLMKDDGDLAARVDRLLCEPVSTNPPAVPSLQVTRNAVLVTGALASALLVRPASLAALHRLLETFLQ
jgi:Peptidase family M48